jgi:hypothetical protein
MKGTVVSLLTLVVSFLAAQGSSHAQSTTTYNASGASAMSNFATNNLAVSFFVARGCPSSPCSTSTGTFIVYFAQPINSNPNGPNYVTEADGFIPDSDFQSNTLQHMSLSVDTSQVPGFSVKSCAFVNGTFNCVNGPYGVIQATWDATQQQSSKSIQDSTSTIGGFTSKTHDDSKTTSAEATGTFLGYSFSSSTLTTMGTNNSHSVSITRPR